MDYEPTREDRRIGKTKKAIQKAFIELLSRKDISKISITEISNLADINRKTFYAHYDNVYAVMAEMENDLVNHFMGLINDYDITKFISNPYPVLQQLTEVINGDIEFYGRLFKDGVSRTILEKVRKNINVELTIRLAENAELNPALLNYTVSYLTGGVISAFEVWFNFENNIPLEELSMHLGMITTGGLKSIRVNS